MNVRFYLSYDNKITLKSHFCSKNIIILSLCMQCCYGNHNLSSKSSILVHGVISLPEATSYDKFSYPAAYTFASGAKKDGLFRAVSMEQFFCVPITCLVEN